MRPHCIDRAIDGAGVLQGIQQAGSLPDRARVRVLHNQPHDHPLDLLRQLGPTTKHYHQIGVPLGQKVRRILRRFR